MTQEEIAELAREEHERGGHYKREIIKSELSNRYTGTRVDQAIVNGLRDCGVCANFGTPHLHSLLQPVTRRHPFELFVADYLSMPTGSGGFQTIALVMDVYTRFRWGFKLTTKGTAKTTLAALQTIVSGFSTPEALMTDGGSHFDCDVVRDYCEANNISLTIISAYSPHIAGLIKNGNANFLAVLRKLCAPGLGEDEYAAMAGTHVPGNWPAHFETAIRILNNRRMPSLQCSPAELMFGLIVNSEPTPTDISSGPTTEQDITTHQA